MDRRQNIVIVTAADKRYFVSLISLLESIKRNSKFTNCIVYNLGLSYWQEVWIKKVTSPSIQLLKLPVFPQKFDGWDNVNSASGCFAWKPTVLFELSSKYKNFVWADAGVLITRSIDDLFPIIAENGAFLMRNYEHINSAWTSDECRVVMATSEYEMNSPQLMGNFFGVSLENSLGKKLFEDWVYWSENPKAITGDRRLHRHDQTILSILAARVGVKVIKYQGMTSIGRFKKDYKDSIANRHFFISHRRWIGLIHFSLLEKKRVYILFFLPFLLVDVIHRYFWRAKWRMRWSFIIRTIYGIRGLNK
jgi:lipopolysaccharide biosynthesis glycosyltransferase